MQESRGSDFKVLLPVETGGERWFDLTADQRKTILGGAPYRVAPMDKSQRVHECSSSCNAVLKIYPDAISVGGVLGAGTERGDVGFGAWMMALMACVSIWFGVSLGPDKAMTWFLVLPGTLFLIMAAVYFFRTAYFLPKDTVLLFNRKTRQVTFSQLRFHSFWRFWLKAGFNQPVTVAWDSVQARSYKFTQFMGSTLRDSYRLEIWAPTPDDPKKLLVKEAIGYLGWYEDEKLWQVYEHIRRYMEEGGPPLQHGEELRKPRGGRDLPPFPDSVLATLGGPALTDEEVSWLVEKAPHQSA